MIFLSFINRIELFCKYIRHRTIDSFGNEFQLTNFIVNEGITVLVNKDSNPQHLHIQPLSRQANNLVIFILLICKFPICFNLMVQSKTTIVDHLPNFYLGTRQVLSDRCLNSITVSINEASAFAFGVLIILIEIAVVLYASFININASHQCVVDACEVPASSIIGIQLRAFEFIFYYKNSQSTAAEILTETNSYSEIKAVFKICEYHLSKPDRKIKKTRTD